MTCRAAWKLQAVLWGKVAVFAGSIFSVSLVASFISFVLGQALLNSHHLGVPVTAHDGLRSVIGAAAWRLRRSDA